MGGIGQGVQLVMLEIVAQLQGVQLVMLEIVAQLKVLGLGMCFVGFLRKRTMV